MEKVVDAIIYGVCMFIGLVFVLYFLFGREKCTVSYSVGGMSCEKIKAEHLSYKGQYVRFSQKPEVTGEVKFWTFAWNDIHVVLPAIEFEHVNIEEESGQYDVYFETADGGSISLELAPNSRLEDIIGAFMITQAFTGGSSYESNSIYGGNRYNFGNGYNYRNSYNYGNGSPGKIGSYGLNISQTESTVRDIFGGATNLSDVMMIAYENTPNQISCCDEKLAHEAGVMIALILKNIYEDVVAVYKGIGEYDGWITDQDDPDFYIYKLHAVFERRPEKIRVLVYKFPKESTFKEIPFMVGKSELAGASQPPEWLVALEKAMAARSGETWASYIAAAKKGGISQKSISRTVEALDLQ